MFFVIVRPSAPAASRIDAPGPRRLPGAAFPLRIRPLWSAEPEKSSVYMIWIKLIYYLYAKI